MTNVKDNEIDLGRAICITNERKKGDTAAGAGTNANSRVEMVTLVGPDALAELVWSPQTGLSIEFVDKKPRFMWEVGPSDIGFLRPEDTEDQKHGSEGHSVASQATCHVNDDIAKFSSSVETPGSTSHGHTGEAMGRNGLQDGYCSEPFLENAQEAILENNNRAERGILTPCEHRERASCCRENNEKHKDEGHRSMESCNDDNLLAKRKRGLSFEQKLMLGSKRIRKQTQECVVRRDSSFMNWISNMVKSLKNHDREISVYDETLGFQRGKMGFQNVFPSFVSQDAKAQETIKQVKSKPVSHSKAMVLADKCSHGSLEPLEIEEKEADGFVKRISLYERITNEEPKGMFDTIRRLRLSRTDILRWTNSRLSVAHLDGFFVRLRLAKWEEGAGGARYFVAYITGSQGETPRKGLKEPIRVNVGGVKCFVESRYVSNYDFLEDELVAWWRKTSKSGRTPVVKDLKSMLAKRKKLGF